MLDLSVGLLAILLDLLLPHIPVPHPLALAALCGRGAALLCHAG